MKKWMYQSWFKLLMMVLCSGSLMGLICCGCISEELGSRGFYKESEEEIRSTLWENFGSHYAAQILENVDFDYPDDTLPENYVGYELFEKDGRHIAVRMLYPPEDAQNFYYAVYLSDQSLDPATVPKDDTLIWSTAKAGDEFQYCLMGALDGVYEYNTSSTLDKLLSQGYYYLMDDGAGEQSEEIRYDYTVDENGEATYYTIDENNGSIDIHSTTIEEHGPTEVGITVDRDDITATDGTVSNADEATTLTPYVYYGFSDVLETGSASLLDQRIEEAAEYVDLICVYVKGTLLLIGALALVFVLSLWYLCVATGRRPDGRRGVLRKIDHIPFELYSFGIYVIVGVLAMMFFEGGYILYRHYPLSFVIAVSVVELLLLGFFILAYGMTLLARLKAKSFWSTTIVYPVGRAVWRGIRDYLQQMQEKVPAVVKTSLLLGGVTVLQALVLLIGVAFHEWDFLVAAFIGYKCVEIPVVLLIVQHLSKIRMGARRVAEGDFTESVDVSRMKWGVKSFGEDINRVSAGVRVAVTEQLKSERMKTELITNVSHDIKTPLTSIINYVDLLQKEHIENETAVEYMEVLSRQSAKLKKLIEDLIEASKAQSGNLEITRERCDVAMVLSQVLGEYEERLSAAELELASRPGNREIYILADGRYLSRIFDNLLGNILKYAKEGTRIYTEITVHNAEARITLKNISREGLNLSGEELMERFVRGDRSRNTEGSGLGLSIAKSLTELMDGSFSLTVDGDLFKVELVFPTA